MVGFWCVSAVVIVNFTIQANQELSLLLANPALMCLAAL
jgi:hypothetical protein